MTSAAPQEKAREAPSPRKGGDHASGQFHRHGHFQDREGRLLEIPEVPVPQNPGPREAWRLAVSIEAGTASIARARVASLGIGES
jgi:hypothetical protein